MKILLENVEDGMITSATYRNKYGQIFLAKGTRVDQNHIRILKSLGINSIEIDEVEGNSFSDKNEEIKKEIESRLKSRMLFEPTNIYEVDMFRVAVKNKMKS